jgi:metallo-beta-lactamase family protein
MRMLFVQLRIAGYRGRFTLCQLRVILLLLLLPDSGHIQEEDAGFLNRHGYTKHAPALPLYDKHQAIQSLSLLQPQALGNTLALSLAGRSHFHRLGISWVHLAF